MHIPQAVNDTVTTNENTSVTGNVSTNDLPSGDGGNVWSVDTPPVNGALIFNNDGSFNYTPTENWYGTDSFTYTLTDVNGDIPTATVTINVNKVDNAPVLNLITDQTTNENQLLQFTITGTDPDGDTLTYYAVNLPGGANLNSTTGLVSWTPLYTQSGTYPVTFYVTDGNLTANQTININVNNVDRAPILNTLTDQTTNINQLLTFTITGTDPDGDTLTYYATNLPTGANLNSTTGLVTWTPTITGTYPVTFYVTDGNLTTNQTININVNKIDQPPILNTITNQTTNENQLLQFTITGTDPDGDSLTYYSLNLPGGANLNSTTGVVTWTPLYTQSGVYPITFYVTDGNLTANQTINITVNNIDRAPILNTITDQTTNINQLLQFTITATDPDGDSLTYYSLNLPSGATINATTGTFTWTPTYTQSGTYKTNFIVSDGTLSNNETISIIVKNVDRAPILNLISNKTVNEGSSLKFVVSGKDPDGDIIKYSVSKLPTGATFNKTNGDFIWTPKSTQIGSYYLTFTVSDGTLKNNEKIKITVNKVDIFDNSIQIENKGKSKIYYNYEITITEPNKTIIKKKYLRILKCW